MNVPEDCSESLNIIVDELLKSVSPINGSTTYFVIFANRSSYMKVDGMTKDHLPIVDPDSKPKIYDLAAKEYIKKLASQVTHEYIFEGPNYFRKVIIIKLINYRIAKI